MILVLTKTMILLQPKQWFGVNQNNDSASQPKQWFGVNKNNDSASTKTMIWC